MSEDRDTGVPHAAQGWQRQPPASSKLPMGKVRSRVILMSRLGADEGAPSLAVSDPDRGRGP